MNDQQFAALRLADALEDGAYLISIERDATAAELRRLHAIEAEHIKLCRDYRDTWDSRDRLHAENQQLRADLEAIGSGGVGPLIPTTVQHQHKLSNDNDLQRENGHLITSSSTVPAGWRLVPVEPTEKMVDMGRGLSSFPDGVYRAMLAAAPQPPAAQRCTAAPNDMSSQVIDALTSYCNTGEIDGADDLLAELLFERDHPPAVEQPQVGRQLESKERQAFDEWCRSVGLVRQSHGIMSISSHTDTAWMAWQAAISTRQQPQGEQEPMAYYVERHAPGRRDHGMKLGPFWKREDAEGWLDEHHQLRALYTSPQTRQPLTVEQIDGIIRDLDPSWLDTPTGFEEEFCRAIERAHKIGGEA